MLKNKPDIHLLISEEQSNPVSHIMKMVKNHFFIK